MKINISTIHKNIFTAALLIFSLKAFTQTNPAITSWLQNTVAVGSYYTSGNSTAITNNILVR